MRTEAVIVVVSGVVGACASSLWIACHLPPLALSIPLVLIVLAVGTRAVVMHLHARPRRLRIPDYRVGCPFLRALGQRPADVELCPLPLTEDERFTARVGAYAAWKHTFKTWLALPVEEQVRTPMPPPPPWLFG